MTISRAILIIAACSALFSLLGGATGYLLGTQSPGYYRWVFRAADARDFDPVQIGIGLGATQGLFGGAVVGLLLVAIIAWCGTRAVRTAAN